MTKVRYINIVRVLGLFLVLAYHLSKNRLPGGFLGVDVFFTFSGYLITSIIISTIEKKGNFDFFSYIKRRFSRIFPSLFFSILFTLPLLKLISPDFSVGIDKQIAGALGFVTNYFEILTGGSYEAQLVPHLYVHTWSLAIELHYYFFWGIYAALILFIVSKIEKLNGKELDAFKIILMISAVIFGLASYVNMQLLFNKDVQDSVAYFATTSHIYPFFIGSIAGIIFGLKISPEKSEKLKRLKSKSTAIWALSLLSVTTLILIIILCINTSFEKKFTYKYGFLMASILTTILILSTRILHELVDKKYKESGPISFLANMSYPIYLFHWPLFIIFSNISELKSSAVTATLLVSLILSHLVLYNIEPIFYKRSYSQKTEHKQKKISLSTVVIGCLSLICVAININILINKKEISALEEEQMVGGVIQNIDKIEAIKTGLNNINEEPFLQKNGINDFDKLKANNWRGNAVTIKKSDIEIDAQRLENLKAKVTIIGDSVTLGARKKLLESIPNSYVDAKGSRSLKAGYELITELNNSDSLGEYVVISLGTNGCYKWDTYIEKIIADLNEKHKLIFVTPYDGRWDENWNSYKTTEYLRELPNRYPNIKIADWAEKISKQPELLGSDKIHIGGNTIAINLFVNTIIECID